MRTPLGDAMGPVPSRNATTFSTVAEMGRPLHLMTNGPWLLVGALACCDAPPPAAARGAPGAPGERGGVVPLLGGDPMAAGQPGAAAAWLVDATRAANAGGGPAAAALVHTAGIGSGGAAVGLGRLGGTCSRHHPTSDSAIGRRRRRRRRHGANPNPCGRPVRRRSAPDWRQATGRQAPCAGTTASSRAHPQVVGRPKRLHRQDRPVPGRLRLTAAPTRCIHLRRQAGATNQVSSAEGTRKIKETCSTLEAGLPAQQSRTHLQSWTAERVAPNLSHRPTLARRLGRDEGQSAALRTQRKRVNPSAEEWCCRHERGGRIGSELALGLP